MCIVVVISSFKICIIIAMCRLCSGELHFQAIGGISYITSLNCCEAGGFVWVSHLSPYLHPYTLTFLFFPTHYIHNIHSDHIGSTWFHSRWWTQIRKSHLHLSCHLWQWHSFLSQLLPREGFSRLMCGFGPGTPRRCVMDLGDLSTSCFWSIAQNDRHDMCLRCGHGVMWYLCKIPYLSFHQHPYQRLCGCEGQTSLWHPGANPG